MWHPHHLDGCTLVIIQARNSFFGGYDVVESGMMEYDGEVLHLVGEQSSRSMDDVEIQQLQTVGAKNAIAACRGFDFFLLRLVGAHGPG